MRVRAGGAAIALVAAAGLAGCATATRIEGGVFRAASGYRVTLPGAEWAVTREDAKADLQLRHRDGRAAMLAHGACGGGAARRPFDILTRHVLVGLRDRTVVDEGSARVNGRTAAHTVMDARVDESEARVRVESYIVKDERCVYDLLFVAAPEVFAGRRPAFQSFVDSFTAP
ncbi:MAG: hypothetical protein WED01_13490 [Candidatus Rokuibacteriota bacterium]